MQEGVMYILKKDSCINKRRTCICTREGLAEVQERLVYILEKDL